MRPHQEHIWKGTHRREPYRAADVRLSVFAPWFPVARGCDSVGWPLVLGLLVGGSRPRVWCRENAKQEAIMGRQTKSICLDFLVLALTIMAAILFSVNILGGVLVSRIQRSLYNGIILER